MNRSLLQTKLYIPTIRPASQRVLRPRLIERLNAGLQGRLTLISAPAGFGKTTLAAEWACSTPYEIAWVSIDGQDNDHVQFLSYLIAALRQVDGQIGQTTEQMIHSPRLPALQTLITPLINDLAGTSTPLMLVLDDYHLITSDAVHQIVRGLLSRDLPALYLVLITRKDPPLPLARLCARGQMTEIRQQDLRLTRPETAAFLRQSIDSTLTEQAITSLAEQTEGWIAGLQMVALALRERVDLAEIDSLIDGFAGQTSHIIDYLISEVLERQPPEVRAFLDQTLILDRLTGPLCNALTGREDGQEMLEELSKGNAFLFALDHKREWYRYHRLFAEALCARSHPADRGLSHLKAAQWYEAQGSVEHAVHHALAYAAIDGDWAEAERAICAAAETTWRAGNLTTLQTWLNTLPAGRVRGNGRLATYQGWVLATLGDMSAAKKYAQAAEACYRQAAAIQKPAASSPYKDKSRLLALHAFLALFCEQDYEQAIRLAEQALRALSTKQTQWRVIALWTMAEAKERTRSTIEAIKAFRLAAQAGRALGSQFFAVVAEMSLAKALNDYGNRRQAIAVCRDAIARYGDERGTLSPIAGLIYSRLGTLYYEANELERALTYHQKGQRLAKEIGLNQEFAVFGGLSAPTLYALGQTEAALAALRAAHDLAHQTNYGDADWYLAWQVNIYLWESDVSTAAARAETAHWKMDDAPNPLHIESHLAFSRLLIAQGRLSDAKRWLSRLDDLAHAHKLYRWQISIHILQSLAAERSGDRQIALHLLGRAVQAAASQDYVRSFLKEGGETLALLPDTRSLAPEFVDGILAYAKSRGLLAQAPKWPIVEPLSDRENQVLRLIAAGLANREIAEELVIAIGTVKRHINNLYGKLGVHTRTQAIAKARDLYILR